MFKDQTNPMIFTDAFFKSVFRNHRVLFPFFQLNGLIIVFLIIMSEHWFSYIVWAISIYIMMDIIKTGWSAFRYDEFIQLFQWDESLLRTSLEKSVLYLSTPILALIGIIFGYLQFQFIGMVLFPIITIGIGIWITKSFIRHIPVS